ncbi:PQQ-binding-like beta-propeller repeat protein [Streptomyces sp. E11-3]|uniref:PQQ-binding-like beta-propeller repeat protein n=1 Tax=Streptomyces sp. E11-3 TaxID=3110112 RepID=UPI00397F7C06
MKDISKPPATPVVVEGIAYVGDSEGTLHAVDAATGRKRWTHRSTSDSRVFSPPAVADGTAYYSSINGRLYAVDTTSGERRWSFRVSKYLPSGPVVADGTVYLHDFNETLHALDAAEGKPRWSFPLGRTVFFDPAVSDGTVCIATRRTKKNKQSKEYKESTLYAVDARTGRERWSFDAVLESEIKTPLAIAEGTVYFGVTDDLQGATFMLYAMAL